MGIHGFFKIKIVNKKSVFDGKLLSQLGEATTLKKFKNQRICVDASMIIYQSILALNSIQSLTDANGDTTAHIYTIFNKIIQLAQVDVIQIWIFDSPVLNSIKKRELVKREERREKSKNDKKRQYKLNQQHIDDIQFLLTNLGITYIVAPPEVEAEQYGAYLTKGFKDERFCQYMLSGDSDVLLFGGNLLRIISEKSASGKSKKTIYTTYDLDDIINECDVSYDQFVKMGVFLGSDFNEKAPEVGPATIMKKKEDVYITPAMHAAIKYFKSDISNKMQMASMVDGRYNKLAIQDFLIAKKFNKDRIALRLDDYEKCL